MVEPSGFTFPNSGGSGDITITAENQGWTINDICDWVSASTGQGESGDTTVTLTVSSNDDTQERKCNITVKGTEEKEANVTIKQARAVLPGISRLEIIELNVPDIPASGGTITEDDIIYTVYAVYEDEHKVELPKSEIETSFNSISADSRYDNVGERQEIENLTLVVTYSGITASSATTVYQEANKVENTWEISGKTNIDTSGWTIGDSYYNISVIPLELTVSSANGETNINVSASAITAETIYSADTWQQEITPWSAYTSLYEKSGSTIILEEIHIDNERVVGEDVIVSEVDTLYKQSSLPYRWITASTVEDGVSRIVYDENTQSKIRTANFTYCVKEKEDVNTVCKITQKEGEAATTRKIEIYINKYIYGGDLNVDCSNFNNIYDGAFRVTGDRGWNGSLEFTGQYLNGGRSSWTNSNDGVLMFETDNMNAMTCTFYFESTKSPGPFDATGTGFFQNLNENIVASVPVGFTYRIPSGIAGTTTEIIIDKNTTNLTFIKT